MSNPLEYKEEATRIGLGLSPVYVVSHKEDKRLYGELVDVVFSSEERARSWTRAHPSDETLWIIKRMRLNSNSFDVVFIGPADEA